MSANNIKVMIVDDSITYRTILSRALKSIDGVEVVGTASNGKIALGRVAALKPDMITLDIEMPVMDGLETLEHLTRDHPGVGVVMVSGLNPISADQTIKALGLGSIEFIVKPVSDDPIKSQKELTDQLKRIIYILRIRSARKGTPAIRKTPSPVRQAPPDRIVAKPALTKPATQSNKTKKPSIVDIILIGSSTGGPKSLEMVIPKLQKNLHVPVLLVQHMPKLFTQSLAMRLNEMSAVTVCEGKDMEKILPGHVYIAPGGQHMMVFKNGNDRFLKLNSDPPENSCRPAVDVLFRSAAEAYLPTRTLCVILTGMGADGRKGVQFLKDKDGGYCLAQSEKSCVVYGMPLSIVEADLDSEVVDLEDITERIVNIVCG